MLSKTDFTQRFIFDNHDASGQLVCLEQSYGHVLEKHKYPQSIAILLGELMAAASLLADSLKFEGLLALQVRGNGPLSLLMVECSSERDIRAIARYDETLLHENATFMELVASGVFTVTIEPRHGQRYQGIVALDGTSIAECLNNYFSGSEQLASYFYLAANGIKSRGFLLQQLPPAVTLQSEERKESWQHLSFLAQTLTAEELLGLDNKHLLHRLYHEDQVRLFEENTIQFRCSCSRVRSQKALWSLGEPDVLDLLEEQGGKINIECQFCNQCYSFNAEDVCKLFLKEEGREQSSRLH